MVDTTRLQMTLVEIDDIISTEMKDKINNALTKLDSSVGYVLCTSATRPTPFIGMLIFETDTFRKLVNVDGTVDGWRQLGGDGFDTIGSGSVRVVKPVRAFAQDTNHSAFPGICVMQDGRIRLVYRQGTDHVTTRDGVIKQTISLDQGRTWTAPANSFTPSGGGIDYRDPCLSESIDGNTMWLTYFKGSAALAAAGVFFRSSTDGGATWSTETRVDTLPYAASSAPIVELTTGKLLLPYYGRSGAEVIDSVWIAESTNGGTSWTSTRIVNGPSAGRDYQEPWIARKGTTLAMTFRWGNYLSIGSSLSTDNGANWSAGAERFTGTGRPACFYLNEETLAIVYRRLTVEDAVIRSSKDNGTSWTPERMVDPAPSAAGWMTYASASRVGNGTSICAFSQESGTTTSRVYLTYVGQGGATTPFGSLPNDADAAAGNNDTVLFGTMFEQPDGALVAPWTIAAGALTVANGYLQSASADNVPDYPRVFVGTRDVSIEADIWAGDGGFEAGFGMVFRMINANSFLLFTVETGGQFYRIYKIVSGVTTSLYSRDTTASAVWNFNSWHTLRVDCKGNGIWAYVNDVALPGTLLSPNPTHVLSAGDMTTFQSGFYHGLKLNSQGTTTHKCRRFVVRG